MKIIYTLLCFFWLSAYPFYTKSCELTQKKSSTILALLSKLENNTTYIIGSKTTEFKRNPALRNCWNITEYNNLNPSFPQEKRATFEVHTTLKGEKIIKMLPSSLTDF